MISKRPLCRHNCWLEHAFDTKPPESSRPTFAKEYSPASASERQEIAKKVYTDKLYPWQTRIIKLWPASFTDPLRCDLFVAEVIANKGLGIPGLSKIVPYYAISYSWGYTEYTARVICNGFDFPVTQHLENALKYLRSEKEELFLWIDAFCINQTDDEEKALQLQTNFTIFKKALRVLVWLDVPTTEDNMALTALELMSPHRDEKVKHRPVCLTNLERMQNWSDTFLNKPWFSRTWVRQEVFAASNIILCCGMKRIGFLEFSECELLIRILRMENASRKSPKSPTSSSRKCFHDLERWVGRKSLRQARFTLEPDVRGEFCSDVLQILLEGCNFQCTEPKDRVYGVKGMLDECLEYSEHCLTVENQSLPINYKKPLPEIYGDIIKYLTNHERNLAALCIFQRRDSLKAGWPSWTIDLTQNVTRYYSLEWKTWNRSTYRKGRTPPPRYNDINSIKEQNFDDGGRFCIRGFRVGSVRHTQDRKLPKWSTYQPDFGDCAVPYSRTRSRCEAEPKTLHVVDLIEKFSYGLLELEPDSGPTTDLYFILAPEIVEVGDIVVQADGANVPFALRGNGDSKGQFLFLGPVIVVEKRPRSLLCINNSDLHNLFCWRKTPCLSSDHGEEGNNNEQDEVKSEQQDDIGEGKQPDDGGEGEQQEDEGESEQQEDYDDRDRYYRPHIRLNGQEESGTGTDGSKVNGSCYRGAKHETFILE